VGGIWICLCGRQSSRTSPKNKSHRDEYLKFLQEILVESDHLNKAQNISNLEENGFNVNSEPRKAITKKGIKTFYFISAEKGQRVTLLMPDGRLLAPAVIF
jgi:hypothetical protein